MDEVTYYIHKYETRLNYGGPEEGGWYYTSGVPAMASGSPVGVFEGPRDLPPKDPYYDNKVMEDAYAVCLNLNALELDRRHSEETYPYHSVLAYKSRHYEYAVSNRPIAEPFPQERPHYE